MLLHLAAEIVRLYARVPFALVKQRPLVVHIVDVDVERRCGVRVGAVHIQVCFSGLANGSQ